MIGFVTGSDGEVGLAKGLGDLSECHSGIVFTGGMARVAMSEPPELTADPEKVQDWTDACGLLSFVMYALDREDWMAEFIDYEEAMKDAIMDAIDKVESNEMRSKLTVIEGGLGTEEGGVGEEG